MLYYLFNMLDEQFGIPGAGVFQFISFRAGMAIIFSLLITLVFGGRLVAFLHRKQVGESVRDLGLKGQKEKEGTPTMGGLIILAAIIIPTLLFAKLDNIYILLMLLVTVWMGLIGFLDDYIKVFKKNKKGLAGKFKIFGQISLGLIVGSVLFFHEDVIVRVNIATIEEVESNEILQNGDVITISDFMGDQHTMVDVKKPVTTIPFLKNHEIDYSAPLKFLGPGYEKWAFLIFIPVVIFIVTAVSNGANMTDGLDGLATGTSAIIGATLGVFAYVSGNIIFANYLNIMYIPFTGELVIFTAAFIGACIGFLWHNAYPAQVFMGDTGSLAIGGIIAALAIIMRKELLLPILCGIFLLENLSVIIQVFYFKYTRMVYGEGKRFFLMAPIHHHFQKKGMHESKIVSRFWIIGLLLAVMTIITLKLR
ncbi:MAG: phospho-N-acetylmuramoyl-pentapeptide-transferase [Chitinophagaceae bacterium]|nr:MAG: phospho-N-acetylmuramoyl-pentapeptide-transferase [Chitinophagaceae bacterium]